jgi:hypothetical protein
MLPLVCTCGEIWGNKEIVYEREMKKLCETMGLDKETITQGIIYDEDKYKKERSLIVNKLCRRICCRQAFLTYSDIAILINIHH